MYKKRHTYDACSLARWVKSCLKPQGTELREAKMSTSVFTFACEFHEERFAFWLLEQLFFVLDSKENWFFPLVRALGTQHGITTCSYFVFWYFEPGSSSLGKSSCLLLLHLWCINTALWAHSSVPVRVLAHQSFTHMSLSPACSLEALWGVSKNADRDKCLQHAPFLLWCKFKLFSL